MEPKQIEIKFEVVKALSILYDRLTSKCIVKRPRDYTVAINEAIQEVCNMMLEYQPDLTLPVVSPGASMSVMESQTDIGHGVTLQCWFTRNRVSVICSDMYALEDGSIVAYQDCVDGETGPLYMDENFKQFHEGEKDQETILSCAGVHDLNKVLTFNRGR